MGSLLSEEQSLLIQAAFHSTDHAVQAWQHWNAVVDLDDAGDLAYRLVPRIYRNLGSASYAEKPRLKGIYRRTMTANVCLVQRYSEAMQSLHAMDVSPVLLGRTGALLSLPQSQGVYEIDSLELLLPPDLILETWQHLTKMGWLPSRNLSTASVSHLLTYDSDLYFVEPAQGLRLGLRWRLRPHTESTDLFHAASPINVAGVSGRALAPHHQVIDLAWPRPGSNPLDRVLDLLCIIAERPVKWDAVSASAVQFRYQAALLDLLVQARKLAPHLIPPAAVDGLAHAGLPMWQRIEHHAAMRNAHSRPLRVYLGYCRAADRSFPSPTRVPEAAAYLRRRWRRPTG